MAVTPTIRHFTPADREAVIGLKWQMNTADLAADIAAGRPFAADTDPTEAAAEATAARHLAKVAAGQGACLLAERDGAVIGYVMVHFETSSPTIRADRRDHAYVAGLVVDQAHRGAGVGTALLHAAEALAAERGLTRMTLGVYAGNARARRLYERFGFAVTSHMMTRQVGADDKAAPAEETKP